MTRPPLLPALLLAVLAAGPARAQQTTPPLPEVGSLIQVQVSFFLIDVRRILDADQSIEADLFYRVEWDDGRLAAEGVPQRSLRLDSVWSPALQPIAPRGLTEMMPKVVLAGPDGHLSYTQRLVGRFGTTTNLKEFPFDRHDLPFAFAIPNLQGLELELVPGPLFGTSSQLSIPDWRILDPRLDLSPYRAAEQLPPIPGASLVVTAVRNTAHYLTKVIFPLVVIMMISWVVFWAPPTQIGVQFGFAATNILTVIAYRFALAGQLPPVPYSTRLDTFLTGAFLMGALALVQVAVKAQLLYREKSAAARRMDLLCRGLFPVLLVGIAAYSFLL